MMPLCDVMLVQLINMFLSKCQYLIPNGRKTTQYLIHLDRTKRQTTLRFISLNPFFTSRSRREDSCINLTMQWDLWWTRWHWNRFFCVCSCVPYHHHSSNAAFLFTYHWHYIMSATVRVVTQNTLLTPWSTDLPEKLADSQLVKKFPAFYGIRWFITVYTRARHLSLSWAR